MHVQSQFVNSQGFWKFAGKLMIKPWIPQRDASISSESISMKREKALYIMCRAIIASRKFTKLRSIGYYVCRYSKARYQIADKKYQLNKRSLFFIINCIQCIGWSDKDK